MSKSDYAETVDRDPLERAPRDLATVDTLMPEKQAVMGLWYVSDHDMGLWDMETFISSATTARALNDLSNWILGRLSLGLAVSYGADSLGQFAKEIGVPKASLAVYRWVAEAFKNELDTDLTLAPYSYYRLAAGTTDPMHWIQKSLDDELTYEALKYLIDESKGRIKDEDGNPMNKPKLIPCDVCGGWQIVNTDNVCGGHQDPLERMNVVVGEIVDDELNS